MKKLSIITVCLNAPKLELTCESIVNQTFQEFEWIVIDGGSNEQTLAILEKYKHRMDYFVSEKDNGAYFAMNRGIIQASGEWLNFMNASDRFSNTSVLENVFSKIQEYDPYDVLYGDYIREYESKNIHICFQDEESLDDNFFVVNNVHHQALFTKKYALIRQGLYDTQYKILADHKMQLELYLCGYKFKHIHEFIDIYDTSGLSSTRLALKEEERAGLLRQHFSDDEIERASKRVRRAFVLSSIREMRQRK